MKGWMQNPSKWRFSANCYFCSKLAQTLQIDWKWTYQHCPGIFLSDLKQSEHMTFCCSLKHYLVSLRIHRWLNWDVRIAMYPEGWGFTMRNYEDCVRKTPNSFFFFSKTASSLPLQAAEIEELSYVKKRCPGVFLIWFELYFCKINYKKTLSASHLKTMESAKRHMTFCCSFKD